MSDVSEMTGREKNGEKVKRRKQQAEYNIKRGISYGTKRQVRRADQKI